MLVYNLKCCTKTTFGVFEKLKCCFTNRQCCAKERRFFLVLRQPPDAFTDAAKKKQKLGNSWELSELVFLLFGPQGGSGSAWKDWKAMLFCFVSMFFEALRMQRSIVDAPFRLKTCCWRCRPLSLRQTPLRGTLCAAAAFVRSFLRSFVLLQ